MTMTATAAAQISNGSMPATKPRYSLIDTTLSRSSTSRVSR